MYSNSLAEQTREANIQLVLINRWWRVPMGKCILRNHPMGILVISPMTLLKILVVGLLNIGFVGVPAVMKKTYANFCDNNCGLTFLPLERNRVHLLPQPTVLFPPLLFFLTFLSNLLLGIAHLFHVPTLTLLLGKSIKMPNVHVFLLYLLVFLTFRVLNRNRCHFQSITLYRS